MQFLNTPFEVSFKVNQIIYNAIMMADAAPQSARFFM